MQSQILEGDCHEILPKLPTSFAQAVFVDPPYNIGIDYGNGARADRLPEEEYLAQMRQLVANCVSPLSLRQPVVPFT